MQRRYAPGTSRGTRSATTLLAQVADLERGQRIKAQREDLHLTQPAVVDLLEAAARELPDDHPLHPRKLGKPPVTLRGYQTWEQGGGVAWEKAKLLARVLHTDVAGLINGAPTATPDPFASADGTVEERLAELADQLAADRQDRQENVAALKRLIDDQAEAIRHQAAALIEQAGVLGELRDAVKDLRETIATQQAAARRLEQMTEDAVKALPAPPARRAARKAPTGTSKGS